MKSRERILSALKCEIPDRVPIYDHLFSPNLQKEIIGYRSDLFDGEATVLLAKKLGIDAAWIPINGFCGTEEASHVDGSEFVDEWGVKYVKNGWPIMAQIESPIKTREDWINYSLPEINTSFRLKKLNSAIKTNQNELALFCGLLGPFTMMSWYFMDITNFSMAIFTDTGLVHEMNEAYVNWALAVGELAAKTGAIDAFYISDDWGSTQGPLIAPMQFTEFFIPWFHKLVEGLKKYGLPVIMHNDGNIWDLLDELADTGISAINPIERSAGMDLMKVKEKYKGKLCCIGNVDNKTTLVKGSVEEVIEETKECMEIGKPGGGYIISSDHSFHDGIPVENLLVMIETAHKYGEYK